MIRDRHRRIAILGCGGFIGSHLLGQLLDTTEYLVEGVDVSAHRISKCLEHKNFIFHQTDCYKSDFYMPLLQRSKIVISLAALCNPYLYTTTPVSVIESNIIDMYPVVKACAEYGCRLIHCSTSEVYGRTLSGMLSPGVSAGSQLPDELDEAATPLLLGPVTAQRWCYASAKQLLERVIYAYGFERGLDYTILRPFNFIGRGMDYIPGIDGEGVPRVFACFMNDLFNRKPLQLVDGGENRRCFTSIDDAIDAMVRIIAAPEAVSKRIFNVGNPSNELSIRELAFRMIAMYEEITGCSVSDVCAPVNIPSIEFYGAGYEDSDRRLPSISALVRQTGWKPQIDLDSTIRRAMEGFITDYPGRTSP